MRAFILVGGLGTRLRSLKLDIPKPMIDIGGKPFLTYLLDDLKNAGIHDFVLCLGFGAERVESYFGTGEKLGIRIEYSREHTPLGTAGAIKHAEQFAAEKNFILNGDSYLALDYGNMLNFHRKKNAQVTIACTRIKDTQDYGNISLDSNQRITAFAEKNPSSRANLINGGVYLFNKSAFELIPAHKKVSLENEIFPLIAGNEHCYGFVTNGYFIDIGTPERLRRAQTEFLLKKGHENDKRQIV
ncbi:nucleotidyltransferase family protein [candidate division KSB1 bacterium]|nr:nucleotidyltransferase family protein [candidate division KSB1 bacterium]